VADFPGFGISGYRTLAGEVQWIPLDPAITVFLGGNNSGKSNILRLVHEHMGGIFHSLKEGQALNTFNPRVDAPRDRGDVGLRVVWALDVHTALHDSEAVRHDLVRVLELLELNELGFSALPFKSASLSEPLAIDPRFAQALPPSRELRGGDTGDWNFSGEGLHSRGLYGTGCSGSSRGEPVCC
jgi:hypothetical protein